MRSLPDFGTLLLSYREQHGLSQRQVAEQLQLSRNYVSQIERGQAVNLSFNVAQRILNLCDAHGQTHITPLRESRMSSVIHFRRVLSDLNLERVKQQADRSWLSSQTMPTETVDILVTEVEQLRRELHDEQIRRDEWEKMYNQAIAGTEVERLGDVPSIVPI